MRFLAIALFATTMTTGCVSKSKYAELESQYDAAKAAQSQAEAERDAANDQVKDMKERNRKRLERFASVYEELLKVEADKLAKVRIEDGRAVLQLDSDVLFASGSAQLTNEGKDNVAKIAKLLSEGTDARFQVEGHTDNDPLKNTKEFPTNWHLGADRAINVVQAMVAAGMPAERISAATFSEFQPVADNATPEGKKENRRIELVWMADLTDALPYKQMMKAMKEKRVAEKAEGEAEGGAEAKTEEKAEEKGNE